MSSLIESLSISARDAAAEDAARRRIDNLTKPVGSLGSLEVLAVQLAGIAGGLPTHKYERRAVLIGAADHGVAVEGVSAYPQEVTGQMLGAFLGGFAAINALARTARAEVFVADFGVLTPPRETYPRLFDLRCGPGTANLASGPAIAREQVANVLEAGVAAVDQVRNAIPFDVLALGDMGIGNTTSAAAIVCAFTGAPASVVVGRGTGIDDARLTKKVAIVERALSRLSGRTWEEIASELGGYEIVALAGAILRAAEFRVPIVLDGFIVAAAALLARAIAPKSIAYCIASHRSQEPGHTIALASLGLKPLLDLELRLGEASGAALALPILEAAARMICEMRTFEEAGVATETSGDLVNI
ncbi:MAG TPA: nicotinate-nucleotide--dimethylbenzimidazole phosphoribosyltransferase [Candidatus Baltobacteraceae bacterium]|jgi:nicotinate-nucleotide--dimethylbenzimidazole phosphoribosyltransferase|nr:nicotinate-nucleotide--dimethylbenzimidazole phosphoribosyltransferase [Candidatus Baltobacteraceae bacterium]